MPPKPASNLLPTASDMLPKSAKVIRLLPRSAKAKQAKAPTRITKATVGKLVCPSGQGRKRLSTGMTRFQASGCGSIHQDARSGFSSTVMQGGERGGTLSDRHPQSTLRRRASLLVTC